MEHLFTKNIKDILKKHIAEDSEDVFKHSPLIQYLNKKTKSASKGSKARGSFANIYAIYILVEDYVKRGYHKNGDYSQYEGAIYNKLFQRQRELPFGANLQNHALNNRLNAEFENLFPTLDYYPITRLAESDRYWFNQNLLQIKIGNNIYNLAESVLEIIDDYVKTKMESFERFLLSCQELQGLENEELKKVEDFIINQLAPNIDARLFEIVSFSILKYYYQDQKIYWSFEYSLESLKEENLLLYKTGRTNANDGGIDFVMKPLGRFFQVTETLDFKKYFLDIQKLEKYPITFVVKSTDDISVLKNRIEENALNSYGVNAVVQKYMSCIEEIINIPILIERFKEACKSGHLNSVLIEIIAQSKVEFNYDDEIYEE
jgi:hypothetical protein